MKNCAAHHFIFVLSINTGMQTRDRQLQIIHSKKKESQEQIEKIHQELKIIADKIERNLNQKNNQNDTSQSSNESRITST